MLFSKYKIESQTFHVMLQRILTESFKLSLEKKLISLCNATSV